MRWRSLKHILSTYRRRHRHTSHEVVETHDGIGRRRHREPAEGVNAHGGDLTLVGLKGLQGTILQLTRFHRAPHLGRDTQKLQNTANPPASPQHVQWMTLAVKSIALP